MCPNEKRVELMRLIREEYDPNPKGWEGSDWNDNAEEVADKILALQTVKAVNSYEANQALIASLSEALEPFATVGKIIDGPFGPAIFINDDDAFQSGCAWTVNGERKTLTWGNFRQALAALSLAKSETPQ
jgi:hypothetical protein